MSLVARHLEANGIPTVIFGCARDIVEQAGVPRFIFSDFPLGNPMGRPFDAGMQQAILELGLAVLESAVAPRTTVQTPFVWADDPSWKERYLDPASIEPAPESKRRTTPAGGAAAMPSRDVTIYVTPLCAGCDELKTYLRGRRIPFRIVDVLADEAAAEWLRGHGISATPALAVGGAFVDGADRAAVDRLLGLDTGADAAPAGDA